MQENKEIQSKQFNWQQLGKNINSLNWYSGTISFFFRFMAMTSEPLLAIGIVLSAIDFLQGGSLLKAGTELSVWWSVIQGLAMEISVGPVLLMAIEAFEENDELKTRLFTTLSLLLFLVGGAMLLMQFGLSAGHFTESDLSPYVLWPLFTLRTIASLGFIALAITKHKRFSGSSPRAVIQQTRDQFAAAMADLQARLARQQRDQVEIDQVRRELQGMRRDLAQTVATHRAELERAYIDLQAARQELATSLAHSEALGQQLQASIEEQASLHSALEALKALKTQQVPPAIPLPFTLKNQPKGEPKESLKPADFIRQCLTEDPSVRGAEIIRRAEELGLKILPSHITEIKKTLATGPLSAIG